MTPEEKTWKITQFIDKNGKILDKASNPVHSILEMDYESGEVYSRFRVMSAAQGNGSYKVQVRVGSQEVLNAHGSFTARPHNVTVETYEPGEWEKSLGL